MCANAEVLCDCEKWKLYMNLFVQREQLLGISWRINLTFFGNFLSNREKNQISVKDSVQSWGQCLRRAINFTGYHFLFSDVPWRTTIVFFSTCTYAHCPKICFTYCYLAFAVAVWRYKCAEVDTWWLFGHPFAYWAFCLIVCKQIRCLVTSSPLLWCQVHWPELPINICFECKLLGPSSVNVTPEALMYKAHLCSHRLLSCVLQNFLLRNSCSIQSTFLQIKSVELFNLA